MTKKQTVTLTHKLTFRNNITRYELDSLMGDYDVPDGASLSYELTTNELIFTWETDVRDVF